MRYRQVSTPHRLARIGRVLYGERWQTSLAADLHVADRTIRRWVAGDAPIPASAEADLRQIMARRIAEIGGMIGYSVNRSDRSVLHHPTGALFRYDDAGRLTLLNAAVIAPDIVPLVSEGATEAIQDELEHDPGARPRPVGDTEPTERAISAGNHPNIVDMLAMPEAEMMEFEPESLQGPISHVPDLSWCSFSTPM